MEALLPWKTAIALVGLEACPLSEWIYRGLATAGFEVRYLETRHAQRYLSTRPNKTDKNDARGIANMMQLGHFKPVHMKSGQAVYLRTLLAGRKRQLPRCSKLLLRFTVICEAPHCVVRKYAGNSKKIIKYLRRSSGAPAPFGCCSLAYFVYMKSSIY